MEVDGIKFEFRDEGGVRKFYYEGKYVGVQYSEELLQDVKSICGIDGPAELEKILRSELKKYIDANISVK